MKPAPWRVGGTLALALAPLVRAVVVGVARIWHPEPDPVVVVWAERSAFLDALLVSAYVTVALAVALTAASRRWAALRGEGAWNLALGAGTLGALAGALRW